VTITISIPPEAEPTVLGITSEFIETTISILVLANPRRHPIHHRWIRASQDLHPRVRRELHRFRFLFLSYSPSFTVRRDQAEHRTFDEELAQFMATPPEEAFRELRMWVQGNLVEGSWHEEELAVPFSGSTSFESIAERHGRAAADTVRLALEDPGRLLAEVTEFIWDYWDAAFAAEWKRIEGVLFEGVEETRRAIERDGLAATLPTLSPKVQADGRTFRIRKGHVHDLVVESSDAILLMPSVYSWPRLGIDCSQEDQLLILYSPRSVRDAATLTSPSEALMQPLRAAADDTRMRILRLIAEHPRSTQELASLLVMTEAGVSKHLKILTLAGLLLPRREHLYVVYELVPDAVVALSEGIRSFLQD
jgi:DNA-binding transcriptional ArsR family regulator